MGLIYLHLWKNFLVAEILHIRPQWQKVATRLQHEARKTEGYAVVSVSILIDGNGNPVTWTEPNLVRLEPKSACDLGLLLASLGVDGKSKL